VKTIIIGGVAGGASAAARLRRLDEHAEIILFEQGNNISYANCGLPYYIGDVIKDEGELLLQTPESFYARFRVQVRTRSRVLSIDRQNKTVLVHKTDTREEYTEGYDNLILSTGTKAMFPDIPGATLPGVYSLRTVEDASLLRKLAENHQCEQAVILGGGFVGIELAENLSSQGLKVTVVEASQQILPQFDPEISSILQIRLEKADIRICLHTRAARIDPAEIGYTVTYTNGTVQACDFVVMAAGVHPESQLAADARLVLDDRGSIVTSDGLVTSDPDIYAVGDVMQSTHDITGIKSMYPLAGPANKQGRSAANNIAGNSDMFSGTLASSVIKIFDVTAACSGATERSLTQSNIQYEKIYLSPSNHAGYYPGALPITMKLLFALDGKILGVQCVGGTGTEKRVDIIATAMKYHGTVYDLTRLDLCYAPPYSSAKDPVNMAGYIAENILSDLAPVKHWDYLENLGEGTLLVDVRTAGEYAGGHLENSVNIPVDALRGRLDELPRDRELLIYCQVGLRGYIAQRILMQEGFDRVFNLSGGYRLLQITGRI